MNNTITALYCTKNESEFLERSVSTVLPHVHEVIIFDTLSTDGTKEIASSLTKLDSRIKLIEHDTDFDHGCEFAVRNKALSLCSQGWVLAMDADQLMSDNWLDAVRDTMQDPECECIGVTYEHLVGSYEYVHADTDTLGNKVPDVTWVLFRRTNHLRWRAAAEVCAWAKEQHHASAERSCGPGSLRRCMSAKQVHYGFAKRNAMEMSIYRVGRGDFGHTPEQKQEKINQLLESGNPFKFCGPVKRVDYGPEQVPFVMRDAFDKTYKLELDQDGFIQKRIHVPSGEAC